MEVLRLEYVNEQSYAGLSHVNVDKANVEKAVCGKCSFFNNPWIKAIALFICMLLIIVFMPCKSYAKLSGDGSSGSPYLGTDAAAVGDSFLPGKYVKNFSYTDGAVIRLKNRYTAKTISVSIDTDGGVFSDGTDKKKLSVSYGTALKDMIGSLEPTFSGKCFSGWYIKGNRKLASEIDGIKQAGEFGNQIYKLYSEPSGSAASSSDKAMASAGNNAGLAVGYFLIDPDYSEDKTAASIDDSGDVTVRALWRVNTVTDPGDGNEADDKAAAEESENLDIWDENNAANKLIEYIDSCESKEAYSKLHGSTKYQYGRAIFNAETSNAYSYTWYVKKDGEEYKKLSETSSVLKLEKLSREYNNAMIKCELGFGDSSDASTLTYETKLTVFYLPEIESLKASVNGEEIKVGEVKLS